MRRILMCHPSYNDGVSFYRTQGPLSELYDHVRLFPFDQSNPNEVNSWHWYNMCEILFISRPTQNFHLVLMENARKWGMKIWLDCDDLLDRISEEASGYQTFMNRNAVEIFHESLKQADVITTTTEYLKTQLEERGGKGKVQIIRNGVHDSFLKLRRKWTRNNQIMWRGSHFHPQDLALYSEGLLKVINEYPKMNFIFFGARPFWLNYRYKFKNVSHCRQVNIMDYYKGLCELNSSFQYVVLEDSEFNRSKSNLAWIDGTLAGSAMLVPNWDDWPDENYAKCHISPENFPHMLRKLIEIDDRTAEKMVENSWELIREKYLLSKTNKLRLKIIEGL